jgi:hypothetical protein
LPSHAIELAAVFLDRNVAAILARRPSSTASQQQKEALAAVSSSAVQPRQRPSRTTASI